MESLYSSSLLSFPFIAPPTPFQVLAMRDATTIFPVVRAIFFMFASFFPVGKAAPAATSPEYAKLSALLEHSKNADPSTVRSRRSWRAGEYNVRSHDCGTDYSTYVHEVESVVLGGGIEYWASFSIL